MESMTISHAIHVLLSPPPINTPLSPMDIDPQRRYTSHSIATHVRLGFKRVDLFWKGELRPEGFEPIQRDPIPGISEYDQARWPRESRYPTKGKFMTKDIWPEFRLRYHEFEDLCYMERTIPNSNKIAHDYLACELERRAWEKYGGRVGLEAARRLGDHHAQQPHYNPQAQAALPGPVVQYVHNAGANDRGHGQSRTGGTGASTRLRGGRATAQPSTPRRAQPYNMQARNDFLLSPPQTEQRRSSNILGNSVNEDSKDGFINKNPLPVTPVRDLTRKGKERERQAREAYTTYSMTPSTPSRKPSKTERGDETFTLSQLLTIDFLPSPASSPQPVASSSKMVSNFKQKVTEVDPLFIDLTKDLDEDINHTPSTPSRKTKKKARVVDIIEISD